MLSTFLKMLAGLLVYKIVAVELGVAAIGQVGQFISLMSIVIILSTAGISNGITKLVSEHKNNNEKLLESIQTSFVIITIFSILLTIFLVIFTENIFTELFHLKNIEPYLKYFFILSISLISSSQFFLSVINGFKNTKVYSLTISFASIISILSAYPLIKSFGLSGALIALLSNYVAQAFFLFFILRKSNIFTRQSFKFKYSKEFLYKYANYAVMFIVSALTVPIVQIFIRNMVGDNFSAIDVGYWEALMKISNLYLTFIGMFLSVYYLPLLAEKSDSEIVSQSISFFKILLVLLLVIFVLVFIFKIYIIKILFSNNFLIIADYIYIQQIGDFFKLLSFVFGYIIIVKMRTTIYIVFEIFHSIIFLSLGYFFIYNSDGFYGASIAYAITYIIHFLINLMVFYNFKKKALV